MSITAYPLSWPAGWKRTERGARRYAHFGTRRASTPGGYPMMREVTLAEATNRLLAELVRMGVPRDDIVISTNVALRLDGLPRSAQRAPEDPGAAVYWRDGANNRCIAVDHYTTVEDNLAAIAATLAAMRAIERHGGAAILDRAFTGFTALPAPKTWRDILDLTAGAALADAEAAYRRLASLHHPDRPGGSHDKMAELTTAIAAARKELR